MSESLIVTAAFAGGVLITLLGIMVLRWMSPQPAARARSDDDGMKRLDFAIGQLLKVETRLSALALSAEREAGNASPASFRKASFASPVEQASPPSPLFDRSNVSALVGGIQYSDAPESADQAIAVTPDVDEKPERPNDPASTRSVEQSFASMIAKGSRQAYLEWTEAQGATGAMAGQESGSFGASELDNAQLIIVPVTAGSALLLPGWEIIENFPTAHSQIRTMPVAVREGFQLVVDNIGQIHIDSAGQLSTVPGGFRLDVKGVISGLSA